MPGFWSSLPVDVYDRAFLLAAFRADVAEARTCSGDGGNVCVDSAFGNFLASAWSDEVSRIFPMRLVSSPKNWPE